MSPTSEKRSALGEAQSKSDMLMLCTLKGKERSKTQWEALFSASGFHLEKIVLTRTPFSVTVAAPTAQYKSDRLKDLRVSEANTAAVPA